MGPPLPWATGTLPFCVGLRSQIVWLYSGCCCSSSGVRGAILKFPFGTAASDCDPQQRLARSLEGATRTAKKIWRLFDDVGDAVSSRVAQQGWRIAYYSYLLQNHTTGQRVQTWLMRGTRSWEIVWAAARLTKKRHLLLLCQIEMDRALSDAYVRLQSAVG